MMFGVMWGYPFLVSGQGLSRGLAAVLMAVLALSGLVYGVTIGTVMARYPYYRSLIGIGVVAWRLRYGRLCCSGPGRRRCGCW